MDLVDTPKIEGERIKIGGSSEATIGERIGKGKEGYVYKLEDYSRTGDMVTSLRTVVKILKKDLRADKKEKVEAMVANKPGIPDVDVEDFPPVAWPLATVASPSGDFWGFEMPIVDHEDSVTIFEYAHSDEYPRGDAGMTEVYRTGENLARMVNNIHNSGHAIGDFNHKNIRVKNGYIALVDCDSYHIRVGPGKKYQDNKLDKRYAPPEELTGSITGMQSADLFCLGVHIFQILMDAHHPYIPSDDSWTPKNAGNVEDWIKHPKFLFPYENNNDDITAPPALQERYDGFPEKIRKLFERCFSQTSTIGGMDRPKAKDWVLALNELTPGDDEELEAPWKNEAKEGDSSDDEPDTSIDDRPGSTENPFESSSNSTDEDDAPGDTTSPW